MKPFRLPKAVSALFTHTQAAFWFSSRQLLVLWEKKKKRFQLALEAGFAAGQISNFDQAVTTLGRLCAEAGLQLSQPLTLQTAVVFVATDSSPLERSIVKRVWQKTGFQKVSLVSYATALRAFAQRQAIRTGVGLYIGFDVSEGVVFSPDDQAGVPLGCSLYESAKLMQLLLRERTQLEVSLETAQGLYEGLGKASAVGAQAVRGRNIQTQQIETQTLTSSTISTLKEFFEQRLASALKTLLTSSLFATVYPHHWVVVGDPLLNQLVQTRYQANTVFLHSEFELTQGVQWL
jgi:actin-like ATPase involved in cell morphogenesis